MSGDEIRIAVISDTHGLLRRCVAAEVRDCNSILHAGDVIRESDLDELAVYGNLYAVRGNNDIWMPGVCDLAGILRFQIGGVSFCMVHDRRDVPRDLEGVDAVIYGHSHRYSEEWIDGRLWLNPGSCGRARFGSEVTMAKVVVSGGRIRSVKKIEFENTDE
ncbi:MAG: YfcE family phosphodiesterase [Clostridia bacterium]|nr:YfcE family phosphodiesterase [Clostridia bacterium]